MPIKHARLSARTTRGEAWLPSGSDTQQLLPVQVHFFHFVAEEVRIGLAELGLKSLDDLIGRADLLKQREELHVPKTDGLDLSFIMSYAGQTGPSSVRSKQEVCHAPMLPLHHLWASKHVITGNS